MRAAPLAVIIVTAAVLAACTDDDPTSETSTAQTAPPTASTTPVTDPPPTTSTSPTGTDPPTTTDATTTTSTTIEPTTTTLSVEDQVRAAAFAYDDFYVRCLGDPASCDVAQGTAEGSDARAALTRTVDELVDAGFYTKQEDRGYMVIESIELKDDHTLVSVCTYTTMVLFGPAGPDGQPTIQNDTPGTVREAWQFVQEPDGVWRLRRGDTISEKAGVNECPPEQ